MCEAIGVSDIDELLGVFPEELRLGDLLDLPEGLSEQALTELMAALAAKNGTGGNNGLKSFLGAGAYSHYTPALVDHVLTRSEFFTAYTPYQSEISQGTLQAVFEYQTLMCQLTGMEASNASLYDGASATAEAALMARRLTKRKGIVLASSVHPEYRDTVATYLGAEADSVKEALFCTEAGTTPADSITSLISDDTACVVIQSPNFFGGVEDIGAVSEAALSKGALLVVVVAEPLSLALLKPPGELGADIVVGEGQSFGNGVGFGGPYLGFMAVKDKHLRQMPGRVVGETVDRSGKRAFCLTLATREQHIRREKATSNICTNEGLCALAATVYLTALGKTGLMDLAGTNLSRAQYLKAGLTSIKGIEAAFTGPTFNEFVIKVKGAREFLKKLRNGNILGGVLLEDFYKDLSDYVLVCATETNSKKDMDDYIKAAGT